MPHKHSQTHSQRRYLGHTSFSMHGDRRVYSVPHSQPGIDPFIGHPTRNGKMAVYRAPCICSPIHRDTTTSITRGPSAKPPHPSFFGTAKRRTSSRYQSEGRSTRDIYFLVSFSNKILNSAWRCKCNFSAAITLPYFEDACHLKRFIYHVMKLNKTYTT